MCFALHINELLVMFRNAHGVCCSLKIILELTFSFQKQLFLLVTSLVPVPVTTSVAITKLPVCAF